MTTSNQPALGFMLPNLEWQPWNVLSYVYDLKPTVVLVPLYDPSDSMFQSHMNTVASIKAAFPSCTLLWRMMADRILSFNPNDWANETAKRVAAVQSRFSGVMHLIPWNEPNLAVEGGSEDWNTLHTWMSSYVNAIPAPTRQLIDLHFPAFSPSGNYQAGLAALANLFQQFDSYDVHVYADYQLPDIGQLYPKPAWVTEFNRMLPSQVYVAAQGAGALGLVWFILNGTSDQSPYFLVEPYYSDMKSTLANPPQPQPGPTPPPTTASIDIVDLSDNNGLANADLLHISGRQAAFLKATQGNYYVNEDAPEHLDACQKAGIAVGWYDFADPDRVPDPKQEVAYFLNNIPGGLQKGHVVALDLERGTGPLQAWATVWLQECQQRVGFTPYFYSGPWFMYPHQLHDNSDLNKFPLWFAQPNDKTKWPDPVLYGTNLALAWPVTIWQYGAGPCLGFSGDVDLNVYRGTLQQFLATGKP